MSRRLLGYDDAAKLLGGDSKAITVLSTLAGMALVGASFGGIPPAAGLFELKEEIVDLGQQVTKILRSRLGGLGRFSRSELLEAAHAVIVVSAFFAALDDLDTDLGSTLNAASLELTRAEQMALAASAIPPGRAGLVSIARGMINSATIPELKAASVGPERKLNDYYDWLARSVSSFAVGTAVWDRRNETTRERWLNAVTTVLPKRALTRYEEHLTRLSVEFPEFAFMAHRVGVLAILDQLRSVRNDSTELHSALNKTTDLLRKAALGERPGKVRADLTSRYRDQIAKPVAGAATSTSDDVSLPALRDLYVNPSYRILPSATALEASERITESGWRSVPRSTDLQAMVLDHLLSTEAARVPLMLLGQPGAGKSVFTQILAAELDPRDFLVVSTFAVLRLAGRRDYLPVGGPA